MTTLEIMERAKASSFEINAADTESKNKLLLAIADNIVNATDDILRSNDVDLEKAKGTISEVMLDRLMLNADRIKGMAEGIREVAALPDPVGNILYEGTNRDGLNIKKVSVPLGVTAIIYESRPNVTSDAASLALKSGNACILRCGKEAHTTAVAIVNAMKKGLSECGFSEDLIMLVDDTTRQSATELMLGVGYIDLLIPRGGKGLIKSCVDNAKVPCIETGTGICHVYVDAMADLEKAVKIITNAKTSRPSVCNAEEVCLVDKTVAERFIPMLEKALVDDRKAHNLVPVELRCDEEAIKYTKYGVPAGENDFDTEFLNYILAIKAVDGVKDAVKHIAKHSTHHSDAIVTADTEASDYFTKYVDSAAVYVNASTRFTDGGVFGLGCEMGISTQKLHARGPMGLCELTTYKYVVTGDGHIR